MKRLLSTLGLPLLSLAFFSLSASAQSVVDMSFEQNPLFTLSTYDVTAAIVDVPLTLGGDLVVAGGSGTYAYRWYNAEGTLSTEREYMVLHGGDYMLDVTDQCDCLQTVTFHISGEATDLSGINAPSLQGAVRYDGTAHVIRYGAEARVQQATVFSADGRLVRLATACDAPLTATSIDDQPAGIYIVQIQTADGALYTQKLTKR